MYYNATWLPNEIRDTTGPDFNWGAFTYPDTNPGAGTSSVDSEAGGSSMLAVSKSCAKPELAMEFIAFMYSDVACEIFAKAGAIQPVLGIADTLEGDNQLFYSIYDDGAKAAMGNFAAYKSVPGLGTVREVFFDPVNSLVSGSLTKDQWVDSIKTASDQMRANLA